MKNNLKTVLFSYFIIALSFSVFAGTQRYRISWTDDPSTKAVICWEQTGESEAIVYYDNADHGTDIKAYPLKKEPDVKNEYKQMKNRFARLTGLRPDSVYYFVLNDADGTSKRLKFRTAPAGLKPFTFIAGADSRSSREMRQKANLMAAKLSPLFIAFAGNYCSTGSPEEWKEWLDDWQRTISEDGMMIPIVASAGEQEWNTAAPTDISLLFDTPENKFYALSIGGDFARIWTLYPEESRIEGAQTEWFGNDIETNKDALWKIVQYNSPMRPHTKDRKDGNTQYINWAGIFNHYHVNLVSEAGGSLCKMTHPLKPSNQNGSQDGFIKDDNAGTIFIGEGGWGAPLKLADNRKQWSLDCADINHFFWIYADSRQMVIRAVMFDNAEDIKPTDPQKGLYELPEDLMLWEPAGIKEIVMRLEFPSDEKTSSTP